MEQVEQLILLMEKYKLTVLEYNGIKLVKDNYTQVDSKLKDLWEGKPEQKTEDQIDDELLFFHEGINNG